MLERSVKIKLFSVPKKQVCEIDISTLSPEAPFTNMV